MRTVTLQLPRLSICKVNLPNKAREELSVGVHRLTQYPLLVYIDTAPLIDYLEHSLAAMEQQFVLLIDYLHLPRAQLGLYNL